MLVTLLAISLQACNFTKNELLRSYFSKILTRFYSFLLEVIIYCVLKLQEHLFFKAAFNGCFCEHLWQLTHLSIQSPSKMLFILTAHSYSFLPFLYNLSHRLTALNVYLFYLIKLIFFKNISLRQTHVNVQAIILNFFQQDFLQNLLIKQGFFVTQHKMKSSIFLCHKIC